MTKEQPTITQSDILATEFDRIRLAFDSIERDRDRLKAIITTLRVNAIKGQDPEALLAFVRDGLGGVDAGLTIGEMVMAYKPANHRTTSLAAQDGLVEALADDEATANRIIANAFRAIDMKPQSLFGECYEPGAFIKSIVEQVSAIKGDKS